MIFYAFNGQLGFQTGLNLAMRFGRFAHVEHDIGNATAQYASTDFRRAAQAAFEKNPNEYQEHRLTSDESFRSLVHELKRRIDPRRGGERLIELQHATARFRSLLAEARPRFEQAEMEIEDAIEGNALEAFPLQESPRINRALMRMSTRFDVLENMRLIEVEPCFAHKYSNFISICIHNCALLHAVCGIHSWGWDWG